MNRTPFAALLLTIGATLSVAACGNDAGDTALADAATSTVPAAHPATTHDHGDVAVDLRDYSFSGLPDEIPAGTRLSITNSSRAELHELVAVKLPEGDDRPVSAIVEAGLEELLTAGPPAAVLLAAPGGEQIPAVGDGTLTEPGRYLILCSIPTGADSQEYLTKAAANPEAGPPQVDGGPPHFVYGMIDEVIVTP